MSMWKSEKYSGATSLSDRLDRSSSVRLLSRVPNSDPLPESEGTELSLIDDDSQQTEGIDSVFLRTGES